MNSSCPRFLCVDDLTLRLLVFSGTQYDLFAGFRACFCIAGFYRLDRFGACQPCPSEGLLCRNETVKLRAGFFWRWESKKSLDLYQNFTTNLMIFNDSYNTEQATYNGSFPTAYACPVPESCLGGMESKCADGYQGPLCAVCSKGYYRLVSTCRKCPTLPWLIGRVFLVAVILAFVIGSLLIGRRRKNESGRSVTDILLARLKIVIGFYQVTSGTLTSFSHVNWPDALISVINYAQIVQLNLLQIVPVHCFNNELKVDTYSTFLMFTTVNILGVALFVVVYFISKVYNIRRSDLDDKGLKRANSSSKEQCYRCIFVLLFLTYPALSAQILQMLPAACHEICMAAQGKNCEAFLRFDYSVRCYTKKFNSYAILVYISLVFVVGFPLATLVLLWRSHLNDKKIALKQQNVLGKALRIEAEGFDQVQLPTNQNEAKDDDQDLPGNEIFKGMRFLYENYSSSCWFWEVVDLGRKVVLTSVLALVGEESRTHLGVAALLSGLYTVVFAYYKPVTDIFEYWLQLASLLATNLNMSVGMLLKIPSQVAVTSNVSSQFESVGVAVLLVANNLFVSSIIIGKLNWIVCISEL